MKTHKLSKLINKPEHRLKALMKKHWGKIGKLETIIKNSKEYNVPLSPITISDIEDKIKHYNSELYKISNLWNFKFNDKYMGTLGHRYYKDAASKELVERLNKELKEKLNKGK